MKKHGYIQDVSAEASFHQGELNVNNWLIFIQYACCLGFYLKMNNAASIYFKEKFKKINEFAADIEYIFGWMNLFSRGVEGYFSDKFNGNCRIKGYSLVPHYLLINCGWNGVDIFQNQELRKLHIYPSFMLFLCTSIRSLIVRYIAICGSYSEWVHLWNNWCWGEYWSRVLRVGTQWLGIQEFCFSFFSN